MKDAIQEIAAHALDRSAADMANAVPAAKTFLLDTLGVGIVGSNGPKAADLVAAMGVQGSGTEARVWNFGQPLPAAAAAFCNSYQTHCQEYDCVHEAAVAHVMTVVVPTALAISERTGGVTGQALIEASIIGADVASTLGVAASSGLRFFRPATVGAFGGVAAMGRLLGLSHAELVNAFSLVYGQLCGTMQAHTEGSGLLAMQMGFNARNAVTAIDLARRGFTGPIGVLEGDFGYFGLIEESGDIGALVGDLGKSWRIDEIAHKPFPSGRATHGIIDACLALREEHGLTEEAIKGIQIFVPPLINHLVGRPPRTEMAINYARLCARYVAACALIGGEIALSDFTDEAYLRDRHQALAGRSQIIIEDADPNALTPIRLEITLNDGRVLKREVTEVYGTPANPMTREAQIVKFRGNCAGAARPLPAGQVDELIQTVDELETVEDVTRLVDLTIVAGEGA